MLIFVWSWFAACDRFPAYELSGAPGPGCGIGVRSSGLPRSLFAPGVIGGAAAPLPRDSGPAAGPGHTSVGRTVHSAEHPNAEIITSLPGLRSLTSARVLAEIGDDRSRFADARSLKAYAGAHQ